MTRPVSVFFYSGFGVIILGILSPLLLHMLQPVEPLPRLGHAPHFVGQDSTGGEFDSAMLANKYHLVTFFFSHCTSTCPMQNAAMGKLASEFHTSPDIQFVSITVDPDGDNPAVLKELSTKLGANPKTWHFVRLEKPVLDEVLLEGYKLGSGGKPEYHSPRIILVDATGEIRGYYDGTDAETPARIANHLRQLF